MSQKYVLVEIKKDVNGNFYRNVISDADLQTVRQATDEIKRIGKWHTSFIAIEKQVA